MGADNSSTTARPSRTLIPISKSPVFLPTTASQLYRHIHPILVLSLLYLTFPATVANPITTLLTTSPLLALLQLLYCTICLPPYTSSSKPSLPHPQPSSAEKPNSSNTTTPRPPKRVQFAKTPSTLSTKIIPSLLTLLATLASTPPLTALLILHGAPLTTHHFQTLLLSLHLSLLTLPPLFYIHGLDTTMWREILTFYLPLDEVWGGVVGTVVGAWVAQVALPLDWDREWQVWPVPIVVGGYGGWALGRVGGEFLLKGKRIYFGENEGGVGETAEKKTK